MILDKKIYKKIEHYLYSQFETAEQLEIDMDDIIYGCKYKHLGEEIGGGTSNKNESKVENSALKLIELSDTEESKWFMVIEKAIDFFKGTDYEKIIELTYKRQIRVTKILMMLHIEKSAYYERRNDIVTKVALIAAAKGLIENED